MAVCMADIASPYQHGLVLSTLRSDCAAVELKCTQGADYYNPDYPAWLAEAHAAGLIVVAYHFVDGSAPSDQAANLARRILDKNLPVMIDAEKGSVGLPHILEVCDAMRSVGLRPRLLYLPHSWWQSIGSPDLGAPLTSRGLLLINAVYANNRAGTPGDLYPGDTAAAWDEYGGVTPAFLQFTDRAAEGGFQIDMNAFRGNAYDLTKLLGTPDTAPVPVPAGAAPLTVGTWGPRVNALQIALTYLNCPCGAIDAKFGAEVRAGVIAFQGRYGLKQDGEYGPLTSARLAQRVKDVQSALARTGFNPGPADGIPGWLTHDATKRAQIAHHLAGDEVVGPATSRTLGLSYP